MHLSDVIILDVRWKMYSRAVLNSIVAAPLNLSESKPCSHQYVPRTKKGIQDETKHGTQIQQWYDASIIRWIYQMNWKPSNSNGTAKLNILSLPLLMKPIHSMDTHISSGNRKMCALFFFSGIFDKLINFTYKITFGILYRYTYIVFTYARTVCYSNLSHRFCGSDTIFRCFRLRHAFCSWFSR